MRDHTELGQYKKINAKRKYGQRGFRAGLALSALMLFKGDIHLPDNIEMHHTQAVSTIGNTMSVMTANVHFWSGNRGNNFDTFLEALLREDPDLVCMQEVLADGPELRQLYQEGYNVLFTTTIHYPDSRGRFGNAVISRSPLEFLDVIELPQPRTETPRRVLLFQVETIHGTLDLANMHLSINTYERGKQIQAAYNEIASTVEGICGDLNETPQVIRGGMLGGLATDAFFNSSIATYPAGQTGQNANREIDYVLFGCGRPGPANGHAVFIDSDHLARIEDVVISDCIRTE